MAKYQFTGPDGGTYQIEAPDNVPESEVMDFIGKQLARGNQAESPPVQRNVSRAATPEMSWGETATDVAKSTGIGLAQGAIAIPSLPGNLEYLGRMGIDAAVRGLGYEDPRLSERTALPTFTDIKSGVEQYTGEFYKPKTTAGEYARTIGEFAPLAALGPGGAAARTANVLGPALTSETAGQLTEGTAAEPWARAAGALVGGHLPRMASRTISPNPIDPTRQAMVRSLEDAGVTALTAGQRTGRETLKWAESAAKDIPFNGGRAKAIVEKQAEQFTAAALRRAGINNASRATPEVVDSGFRALGEQFDKIAARNFMRVDDTFRASLSKTIREYDELVPPSQRAPLIGNILADIRNVAKPGEGVAGDVYQSLRSRLERMRASSSADPQLSYTLGRIRDSLDDAMERSVKSIDAGRWRTLRGQYRSLLNIEKAMAGAGENAAMGLISPAALRNAVKTRNRRAYVRGQDDLGNLARAGEAIMKPLPQSGTAPRMLASGLLGAGGYAGWSGDVLTGLGAAVTPAITTRMLMSPPVQRYLANQTAGPLATVLERARLPATRRIPQAAMQAEEHRQPTIWD